MILTLLKLIHHHVLVWNTTVYWFDSLLKKRKKNIKTNCKKIYIFPWSLQRYLHPLLETYFTLKLPTKDSSLSFFMMAHDSFMEMMHGFGSRQAQKFFYQTCVMVIWKLTDAN